MKSIKQRMTLGLELLDQAKIPQRDVLSCTASLFSEAVVADFLLRNDALIRIYHHYKAPRRAVTADVHGEYAHIHVTIRGVRFTGLVKLEEAGQFLTSKQRQLPGPGAKRIAGERDSETSRDLPGQKRLAFAGGDS